LRRWLPTNGVTTLVQPGAWTALAPRHSIEIALDDSSTPFRTFFIADGTTVYEAARKSGELDEVVARTERFAILGRGRVQWLPRQVSIRVEKDDVFNAAFRMYWDAGHQIHVQADDAREAGLALAALRERLAVDRRKDHRLTVTLPANAPAALAGAFSSLGALVTPPRQGLPERRLSLSKGLGSITRDPAYAIQREGYVGSIQAGRHADFAVFEEDPTSATPGTEAPRIWGTVFAGQVQPAASR
jgi:hypothetical protein